MKIFFETENLVVVRKDWGEHVHQPENQDYWVPLDKVLITQLKKKFGSEIYPIHRLDAPTRGLIIFGKKKELARTLNEKIQSHAIRKHYLAVVRGHLKDKKSTIDIPLESDSSDKILECKTTYEVLNEMELPYAVGKRFQNSRYSILKLEIHTGRYHQIRRHMNRISHPIVGDREHGDSHHNRFFRETLQIPHLCLWAYKLEFVDQETVNLFEGQSVLQDQLDEEWNKIKDLATQFKGYPGDMPPLQFLDH